MADGEYTLDDALCDLWAAGKELDGSGGRAETWIRLRIADLEATAKVATMIVRVAVTEVRPGDALVFTLREPMEMGYDGYLHYLDALKQLVARELGHPVPVLLVDGADVSVVRTMQDAGRCLLGFPSSNGKFVCRCTLPACHEGRHDNGNGDTWPASVHKLVEQLTPADWHQTHIDIEQSKKDAAAMGQPATAQIQEDEPRSLFSTGGAGQPAPDHLSEGRLPKRDLATGELLEQECAEFRPRMDPLVPSETMCARERGHTGPHMDRTAIAHAGKAGEVWE